jgi:hypothetical protein
MPSRNATAPTWSSWAAASRPHSPALDTQRNHSDHSFDAVRAPGRSRGHGPVWVKTLPLAEPTHLAVWLLRSLCC